MILRSRSQTESLEAKRNSGELRCPATALVIIKALSINNNQGQCLNMPIQINSFDAFFNTTMFSSLMSKELGYYSKEDHLDFDNNIFAYLPKLYY